MELDLVNIAKEVRMQVIDLIEQTLKQLQASGELPLSCCDDQGNVILTIPSESAAAFLAQVESIGFYIYNLVLYGGEPQRSLLVLGFLAVELAELDELGPDDDWLCDSFECLCQFRPSLLADLPAGRDLVIKIASLVSSRIRERMGEIPLLDTAGCQVLYLGRLVEWGFSLEHDDPSHRG